MDQEDQEFSNALYMAYEVGELKLLQDYVAAGKRIPQDQVFVAGEAVSTHTLVAWLLASSPQRQYQRGRPHRIASKAKPTEQAERNAAWFVAFARKSWCKSHGRNRMPGPELNAMIRFAIEEAAKAFKVPANTIYESNVRNLLKNGSIVVR